MQGKLIYLLEDDTDLLQLIRSLLSIHGIQLKTFSSGEDFKKEMDRKLPDLCIIDINLPDGNGINISTELSSAPFTSHVPVILMSGDEINSQQYQHAGA